MEDHWRNWQLQAVIEPGNSGRRRNESPPPAWCFSINWAVESAAAKPNAAGEPPTGTKQQNHFSQMTRWIVLIVVLAVAGVVVGVFLTRAQVLAAPEQPIAYTHEAHVSAGVQCLFCHSSALRSAVAGIPSVQKCMGCHTMIATDRPEIKKVTAYWEGGEPIPWVQVNRQPDFVYFSHQPHLGAGLSCETCHGDVGHMTVDRPVFKMDMGWCLDCHLKQSQEKVAGLTDCLTCHK